MLTEDEILKLIDACDNIRDKAFVSLIAESGARIGKILNIQLKHIAFENNYGAKVVLFGKTGARKVMVISCAPTLAQMLNLHPQKNNPESLLFVTNMNHRKGNKIRCIARLYLFDFGIYKFLLRRRKVRIFEKLLYIIDFAFQRF